jgi:outer membrane protein
MSNRKICAIFLISSLAVLAGCRTLEAPYSPCDIWVAPKWEKSTRSEDTTWKAIRAEQADPLKYNTLLDLIDIALQNNPTVRKSWENARFTAAKQMEVNGAWYPAANFTYQMFQTKEDANIKISGFNDFNQVQFGPIGTVSYLLFDFGGRGATSKKAAYDILTANFQFNQAIQDLLLNVAESYYGLFSAQSAVVAAKADVDNAKTALDAANKRFAAGLVSKLDVLQAESNYYDVVFTLENAKGQVKTAKGVLAQVLGLSADTAFRISAPRREMPFNLTRIDVSKLIDFGLARRPDIAAARASVRSKQETVKVAESNLLPTINFQSSAEKDGFHYYGAQKAWGDDAIYTAFNVTLNWDVFDGFANFAKKKEAEANYRQERDKLVETELAASSDVWSKYYTFKANIRKLKASKAFFDSSKGSYDLALEGYGAGIKSILDLTQAQSDLTNARSRLISSQRDLFNSFVELVHSMGLLYPGGMDEVRKM